MTKTEVVTALNITGVVDLVRFRFASAVIKDRSKRVQDEWTPAILGGSRVLKYTRTGRFVCSTTWMPAPQITSFPAQPSQVDS